MVVTWHPDAPWARDSIRALASVQPAAAVSSACAPAGKFVLVSKPHWAPVAGIGDAVVAAQLQDAAPEPTSAQEQLPSGTNPLLPPAGAAQWITTDAIAELVSLGPPMPGAENPGNVNVCPKPLLAAKQSVPSRAEFITVRSFMT